MTSIEKILEGFLILEEDYIKENKLQKMCYILDLYWYKEYGEQLTRTTYEKYGFGTFSSEIHQTLTNLSDKENIKFVPYHSYRRRVPRKYFSSKNNTNQLNEETLNIIQEVLDTTRHISQEQLDSWSRETVLFKRDNSEIDFRGYSEEDYRKDINKLEYNKN